MLHVININGTFLSCAVSSYYGVATRSMLRMTPGNLIYYPYEQDFKLPISIVISLFQSGANISVSINLCPGNCSQNSFSHTLSYFQLDHLSPLDRLSLF